MNELTRKQREIQERDELILRTSRNLFHTKGYHNVTMDMIAKEVEYSKGTIYQHYSSKEAIISALCLRFSKVILALFEQIYEYENIPAYLKMIMLLEAEQVIHEYAQCDHDLINLLKTETFSAKLDVDTLHEMSCHVELIMKQVMNIVQEAVENGELVLKAPATVESISLGGWAMIEGTYEIAEKHTFEVGSITSKYVKNMLIANSLIFLRGSGWDSIPVDDQGQLKLSSDHKKALKKFRKYSQQLVAQHHTCQG